MANSTGIVGRTINITLDGTTDWSWNSSTEITSAPELSELSKGRIWVHSILFKPSAADDKIAVREGSLSGSKIFDVKCIDAYDEKVEYYDCDFAGLFISAADVTSSSSATLKIVMM